jgi:nucleoid-associated protein YgaU
MTNKIGRIIHPTNMRKHVRNARRASLLAGLTNLHVVARVKRGVKGGSVAPPRVKRDKRDVIGLFVIVFVAVLLVGCADGQYQTVAEYWGLNGTPVSVAVATATATLPATSTPTVTPTVASTPTATATVAAVVIVNDVDVQVNADGREYQIVRGDSLWKIARAALRNSGAGWGNAAVGRYVADIVSSNPSVQKNPNLIHPNQVVMLPGVQE